MKPSLFVAIEQHPSVPPILGEVPGLSLLRRPGTSSTKHFTQETQRPRPKSYGPAPVTY